MNAQSKRDINQALGVPPPEKPGIAKDESSGGKFSIEGAANKLWDSLTDPKQYAVLGAEWRHGLKDAQDMVLNAFPDGFPQRNEPGTIGNPTQHIVTQEIQGKDAKDIDMEME